MKKIEIKMTKKQHKLIEIFLAENKIYADGKKEFAFVSEPSMHRKTIKFALLNRKQYEKIDTYFRRIGFYK